MYESKYFESHELLPKELYYAHGDNALVLFDENLLITADAIKETFPRGAIYVNNYYWHKGREWSGFRTPNSPYYNARSQHSIGKALDMIFTFYNAYTVRRYILDNKEMFPFIRGVELGVNWLHFDTRNIEKLITFRVTK